MKSKMKFFIYPGILFLVICLFDSFYVIDYDKQGILVQLGAIASNAPLEPGLGIKKPFIQRVVLIERRIVDLPSDTREVIAADQKRIILNYYTKYRIVDPVLYYKSTRGEAVLESRLKPIIESQMREKVGRVPLLGLLSEDRNAVMSEVRESANEQARLLGVSVVDVRIKRTDLPDENSEAVFRRMQTERAKEAKEIRAQGFEISQKIKSGADKERRLIISDAQKKSKILLGEGESEAAKILNQAFSADEDFFNLYRTLEFYKASLKGDKTKIVLSDKDKFLGLFYNGYKGERK